MIIWGLALVLFGCLGLAGWSFGVIRAAFSFVGIMAGLLLARIFGHLPDKLLGSAGVKDPMLLWALGPFLVFLIVLIVFKIAGFIVNNKVSIHYKYKAGDLRMALWNRLSQRLGLCLGLANAVAYLVLISLVIYVMSYVTVQFTQPDKASFPVKVLNAAGGQLKSTGLDKVAAALDPVPEDFYAMTDLAGLLFHNVLIEARLARYPAFLALGEKPEFQAIAADDSFTKLRQTQPTLSELLDHATIKPFTTPEKIKELWDLVLPNLKDLQEFLRSGKSEKYNGEKLLGRWDFNLPASVAAAREARPNMTTTEMRVAKINMTALFTRTVLVATPEKLAYMKNFGKFRPAATPPPNATPAPATPPPQNPPRGGRRGGGGPGGAPPPAARGPAPAAPVVPAEPPEMQNLSGQWNSDGSTYTFRFPGTGSFRGQIQGEKLTLNQGLIQMVFDKE